MSKFKIGDRVKALKGNGWVNTGLNGTVNENDRDPFVNWDNGEHWAINERYLELISNQSQTIIIYRKNLETIASLKEGKKVIRSTSAKCCPADTYDFETGAKLAFQRLMGEEVKGKTTPLTACGFKVGDIVTLKKNRDGINTYYISEENIKPLVGKELKVTRVWEENGKSLICIDDGIFGLSWNPSLFELAVKSEPQFDWQSFKSGKFAVHCDTEEKAREFLKECDEQGIKWSSGTDLLSETNWSDYINDTLYGFNGSYGLYYGRIDGEWKDKPKIDYISSKPTIKEVHRKVKVGEWVKILRVDSFTEEDHKVGDIFQAIKCTCGHSSGSAYYTNREDGCGYVNFGDYVVLEGYIPEEKPTVKRVKRPAKVGEWIEVVNGSGCHDDEYENGDILQIVEYTGESICGSESRAYYKDQNRKYVCPDEYVVLEGYQPPQETPQLFKKAKVGDKIKVVKVRDGGHGPIVKIGDIQTVLETRENYVRTKESNIFPDSEEEYIIIEEAKPIEKKTQFVAIPQSVIDEVRRWAEPQKKQEDEIPCFWDGKRYRDYEKGDRVHVINRTPYEDGYALRDYGEIYQVLHDTVVVLFGGVGINMYRKDIELVR